MAQDNNVGKRVEELEQRASMQQRELVVLADTIKELASQVQQLAEAQVRLLNSHDELLQKISEMDQKLGA